MARIRTIKPEFWSSPDTARASLAARLTYIGLWNWADDYGRGTLNLKELEGFLFPHDDLSEVVSDVPPGCVGSSAVFRHIVKEVISVFGITVYEVDRRLYFEIPSWSEHQRTERRAKSRYPGPGDGVLVPDLQIDGKCRKFLHSVTETPAGGSETARASVPGTGEQGNRGTGEGEGIGPSDLLGYPQPVENSPLSQNSESAPGADAPGEPDPLDALAATHAKAQRRASEHGTPDQWSTPEDPRCWTHRNLPRDRVPACRACGQARTWFKDRDTEAKASRLAAIDACPRCDDRGMAQTEEDGQPVLYRCNHHPIETPPF